MLFVGVFFGEAGFARVSYRRETGDEICVGGLWDLLGFFGEGRLSMVCLFPILSFFLLLAFCFW